MDVRTIAIDNNLESIIDICRYFGLDVHLFLAYLGAKWNHI